MSKQAPDISQSGIDKKAYEALFREYFPGLCAFAGKYVPDFDTAREIVHEVFIKLWEKRDTIDPNKSVKSYLFTSVYNRSMNYIRDHKKFSDSETALQNAEERSVGDVTEKIYGAELEDKINEALEALPDRCREVFLLNRFEELKYREIAERLDISVKTVETQMSKALKILREKLKAYITVLAAVLWFFGGG